VIPLNAPNLVTFSRILLIPVIIAIYYLPNAWLSGDGKDITATAVFIFAGITDWLDGYLARRLNQMSAFGAFLDPVADKLIVVAALLALLYLNRVDVIVALIIVGREIAISALREWMAKVGQAASVAVAFIGKLKTVAQMTAIIALLLYEPLIPGVSTPLLGTIALWIAVILTLWSMVHYLRKAAPYLTADRK